MNGKPPAKDSKELEALSAYAYWLAMGGLLDQYGMQDEPVPAINTEQLLTGGKAEDFPLPEKSLTLCLRRNVATSQVVATQN